jgi:hypothetical protein
MAKLRLCGVLVSLLLCSCTAVLPKPSAVGSANVPSGTETQCRLDLSAARQAALNRVAAAGAPIPAIIVRIDAPSADRVIRNGARVMLRSIAALDHQRPPKGSETDPLAITVTSLGGARSDPVEIFDDSVIRLRAWDPDHDSAQGKRPVASPAGEDFVISKADVPDPNRPTTCDAILRDGDFVYLRTLVPSAWVEIHDGVLVSSAPSRMSAAACGNHDERCYTDRYGGLVCTRFSACAQLSAQ